MPVWTLLVALPWLVVGFGCWLGYQLLRQNGRLLLRLEAIEERMAAQAATPPPARAEAPAPPKGLPIGSAAPDFSLPDLAGEPHTLAGYRGRKTLLIFFNPGCGFCQKMVPDLAALPADGSGERPVPLLVTTGGAERNRQIVEEHHLRCTVLLQEQMEVAAAYQAHGTPTGYLVDEAGTIASALAVGAQALLELAEGKAVALPEPSRNGHGPQVGSRDLSQSKINRSGLAMGTPAPDFRLPLLEGGELSLGELRGGNVLLVFSDPHCGPCEALMPQLEAVFGVRSSVFGPEHRARTRFRNRKRRPLDGDNEFDSARPNTQHRAPTTDLQVLIVSRGEMEENRAKVARHGLTFPVVLQKKWEISKLYAMFATPVAYLIDEQGVIADEVAVGPEPILALALGALAPAGHPPVEESAAEPALVGTAGNGRAE